MTFKLKCLRLLLLLLISFLGPYCIYSQDEKKTYEIKKTDSPPKIDGILNDDIWSTVQTASNFVEFRPDVGNRPPENRRTEVKMTYDDKAIYISAYLYDDPELIMKQFNSRDNFGQTDYFQVIFNPNNDAQNDTKFFVFSSGNQADAVTNSGRNDFGWNAVWSSAVKIYDDGWALEMKIPYRALRFANDNLQTWGLQFIRQFRRDRSRFSWNPIDVTTGNSGLYHGELKNLKDITPPTRLIFYPFASAVVNSFDGETDTELNVGLDVKYGLTENFTLDATVIPDFSQVGFDNLVLNLGPFEQTFSEQRQFFTEGVDLFNKGDLFFSRRIGNAPSGEVELDENEKIVDEPNTVKVLNAIKLSGRTKKGLGIGVFNSITEKTYAKIEDAISQAIRTEVVEPISNYNILVVDQQFNQNSSVSFINTNVLRNGHFRDANVTGALADISTKKNTYNFDAQVKMSSINEENSENLTGFSYLLGLRKTFGNFRYGARYNYADDNYDINDMGLQFRNNFSNYTFWVSYETFKPTKLFNRFEVQSWFNHRSLAKPHTFTGKNVGSGLEAQTKSLHNFGVEFNYEFGEQFDYFEPREEGRFFIYENELWSNLWFSSNYNNVFAIDARFSTVTFNEKGRDSKTYRFRVAPRIRFSDKFLIMYSLNYDIRDKDRGYATTIEDDIIFGQRDRNTATHTITGRYNFDVFHSLSLSFRNYWSTVTYEEELFTLAENGRLTKEKGYLASELEEDPNINFSTWNLDLNYSWQFAPGSFLTALYRNQLFNSNDSSEESYFETLDTLFDQPIQHTFSLRVQYFIDYNDLKKVFKNKNSS